MPTRYSRLSSSELRSRADKLKEIYKNCVLCPWECRIDRTSHQMGVCRSLDKAKVSSATPHFGEEPMISGTKGSGTIFFSNCNMRCKFCQNYQISQDGLGDEISDGQLSDMMLMLAKKGCHNINLVSPTHYTPNIIAALAIAAEKGLDIPLVYNSNGYEKVETLKILDGIIDIYLPDIKYTGNDVAIKLSNSPKYVEYNRAVLKEMYRQVGQLKTDENGVAESGLLIRHLVLPHDQAGSEKAMKLIAKELSKDVNVGIMAQYRPCYRANEDPHLDRPITGNEYRRAVRWAKEAGLHNILVQELDSSDILVPDFKRADPFK